MMAIEAGYVETARLLVEQGADLKPQNESAAIAVCLVEPKVWTRFCIP